MPLVSRTRATLRSAEFGFFGVVVKTRVHTPRRWGAPLSAGVLVFDCLDARPLRTSCSIVGTRDLWTNSELARGNCRARGLEGHHATRAGNPRVYGLFGAIESGTEGTGGLTPRPRADRCRRPRGRCPPRWTTPRTGRPWRRRAHPTSPRRRPG